VFKGEILNRNEQPVAAPDSPVADDQTRKARRSAKPAIADEGSEKPRSRTLKAKAVVQPDAAHTEAAAPEVKAPAKRVRKAGTTDAAAN
jgi:hypothetical protein